jgi:hypothetical protein
LRQAPTRPAPGIRRPVTPGEVRPAGRISAPGARTERAYTGRARRRLPPRRQVAQQNPTRREGATLPRRTRRLLALPIRLNPRPTARSAAHVRHPEPASTSTAHAQTRAAAYPASTREADRRTTLPLDSRATVGFAASIGATVARRSLPNPDPRHPQPLRAAFRERLRGLPSRLQARPANTAAPCSLKRIRNRPHPGNSLAQARFLHSPRRASAEHSEPRRVHRSSPITLRRSRLTDSLRSWVDKEVCL